MGASSTALCRHARLRCWILINHFAMRPAEVVGLLVFFCKAIEEGRDLQCPGLCARELPPQMLIPCSTKASGWIQNSSEEGGRALRRSTPHLTEASPLWSCRRLSWRGKQGVNTTVDLDPGTKPTKQHLSWVWLHRVLTEHLLAPVVPGVTAALVSPVGLGGTIMEQGLNDTGIKGLGWVSRWRLQPDLESSGSVRQERLRLLLSNQLLLDRSIITCRFAALTPG